MSFYFFIVRYSQNHELILQKKSSLIAALFLAYRLSRKLANIFLRFPSFVCCSQKYEYALIDQMNYHILILKTFIIPLFKEKF